MQDFNQIAMKLFPPGYRPTVGDIRWRIADYLRKAHTEETKRIEEMKVKLEKHYLSVATELGIRLKKEKEEFKKIVSNHLSLLSAVERWLEWSIDGTGTTDDQSSLWNEVKKEWKKYKTLSR